MKERTNMETTKTTRRNGYMNEKNTNAPTSAPKKGQKPTRRYNRKPKQPADMLEQAVQSAIELVKDSVGKGGKTAKTKDTNKKAAQNKGKQENNKEKNANNRTENRGRPDILTYERSFAI